MNYVILDADEVPDIVFSEVLETSEFTLRYNVLASQTFVKYEGAKPRFLYGKPTKSHSQMLALMITSAWVLPISLDED